MKLRGATAIAAMIIGALGVTTGTAHADPVAPTPGVVNYQIALVDRAVVATVDSGEFTIRPDGQVFELVGPDGGTLLSAPLSFSLDGVGHPFVAQVSSDQRSISLVPDMDPARAWPVAVNPAASLVENQRAQEAFSTQFGIASAIGGFTGAIIGLVVGCILGIPLAPTVAGFLGLCATGAALGATIGTIVAGGPTLIIAGIDLVNTLNAPPGTTKWNYPDNVVVVPQ